LDLWFLTDAAAASDGAFMVKVKSTICMTEHLWLKTGLNPVAISRECMTEYLWRNPRFRIMFLQAVSVASAGSAFLLVKH
jgi:hypothetical protein